MGITIDMFPCLDSGGAIAECYLGPVLTLNETFPYVTFRHMLKLTNTQFDYFDVRFLDANCTAHNCNYTIPYPRIHSHHIHVGDHWFETHGDYYSSQYGYRRQLDDGTCAVAPSNPLSLHSTINIDSSPRETFRILITMRPAPLCKIPLVKCDIHSIRGDPCWARFDMPSQYMR
jgi:hypothetical protein